MNSIEQDQRRAELLREGLIGDDPDRRYLYVTNALFKMQIDSLVNAAPAIVRAMAEEAIAYEEKRRQAMDDLARYPQIKMLVQCSFCKKPHFPGPCPKEDA